jgi:adenylate kinase family enzyme
VSVVGSPGSGKTTVGRALAGALDVPFIELDSIFHQPGWVELDREVFRSRVREAADADSWVIDGNYSAVRGLVWARADTVVFLDVPRRKAMASVIRRSSTRVVRRTELWNGNRETVRNVVARDSILVWTWTQHHKYGERYIAAARDPTWRHLDFVRLRSRREAVAWLAALPR